MINQFAYLTTKEAKMLFPGIWVLVIALLLLLTICGCAHNPHIGGIGTEVRIGTPEYGEIAYRNGLYWADISRENSSWGIEIDDSTGIVYDDKNHSIKVVKRIKRTIGPQVTGYLVDLAKTNPDLAKLYLDKTLDTAKK